MGPGARLGRSFWQGRWEFGRVAVADVLFGARTFNFHGYSTGHTFTTGRVPDDDRFAVGSTCASDTRRTIQTRGAVFALCASWSGGSLRTGGAWRSVFAGEFFGNL